MVDCTESERYNGCFLAKVSPHQNHFPLLTLEKNAIMHMYTIHIHSQRYLENIHYMFISLFSILMLLKAIQPISNLRLVHKNNILSKQRFVYVCTYCCYYLQHVDFYVQFVNLNNYIQLLLCEHNIQRIYREHFIYAMSGRYCKFLFCMEIMLWLLYEVFYMNFIWNKMALLFFLWIIWICVKYSLY